jgi:hypothetical protein
MSRHSLRCFAAAAPAVAADVEQNFTKSAHGFELQRSQFVREYDSHVLLYKHKKTGAELISVVNKDENKTFGAVFRTPVGDSTGIPHILEHSVLCGSRCAADRRGGWLYLHLLACCRIGGAMTSCNAPTTLAAAYAAAAAAGSAQAVGGL